MSKLILRNWQSPGDVLMLTAAVRDLHRGHGGRFVTDVRTPCEALWQNNPYLTSLHDGEAEQINCEYPLIHQSNNGPWHFIQAFHQFLSERLGIDIRPTEFKGDIHLAEIEKSWMSQVQEITKIPVPFWIVTAGGKFDFTAKWWDIARMQEVINHFRHKILFVQVGEENHHHPSLRGVLDLRGKTDLRQFVRLMHHAHGVLCPVTFPMHLAAAVETLPTVPKNRPCVVVAGGREPTQWEAYPHHQFINTNGALLCCDQGGCWKSRVVPLGDGEPHDEPRNLCVDVVHLHDEALSFQRRPSDPVPVHARPDAPGRKPEDFLPRCLDLITAEEVIRRIELYFAGGAARYLNDSEWAACHESLPGLGWNGPGGIVTSGVAFPADDRRFKKAPTLALVVGTFAGIPYVHLHLEARRRLYPATPLLVHDDCSPVAQALELLCRRYGAAFEQNSVRLPPCKGDLSAFVGGLRWAKQIGADLLIKMSRRFVPRANWVNDLTALALESDYATYCSWTKTFDFGFRSECVGMAVQPWSALMEDLMQAILNPPIPFVEGLLHNLARRLAEQNTATSNAFDARVGARPLDRNGYAPWPFMGTDRCKPSEAFLWHDSAHPSEYAALAQHWGLPYAPHHFVDPNMGFGATPA